MLQLFKTTGNPSVLSNELDDILDDINLIDIREPYEFKTGSIKKAKNIPMGELLETPAKYLSKDKQYHIMCHSGMRSMNTVKMLEKQGYNVVNVKGGMSSYSGKNFKK